MTRRAITELGLPVLAVALAAVCVAAQRPKFDAVSVKASQAVDGVSFHNESKHLDYHNVTLLECIARAYGLDTRLVAGPEWLATDRYSIVAVTATEASATELMAMLQGALEDRFNLKSHREQRNHAVYTLVTGEHGMKLRAAAPDGESMIRPTPEQGMGFSFTHVSMPDFANKFLSIRMIHLDRPVIDSTGLEGSFDFTLKWTANALEPIPGELPDGPSIFQAVQDQLGLKLLPKTVPLDTLIVDHVDRVPTEN